MLILAKKVNLCERIFLQIIKMNIKNTYYERNKAKLKEYAKNSININFTILKIEF